MDYGEQYIFKFLTQYGFDLITNRRYKKRGL